MATSTVSAWRTPPLLWIIIGAGLSLAIASSFNGLAQMVQRWDNSEEYGYGYMIPPITLFLIWQRKDKLALLPFMGSWVGVMVLILGALVVLVGQLSTLHSITQYGFLIALIGGLYGLMGRAAFKIIVVPLLLLFLMVPLPTFLFNNLSSQLQLISSEIGVAFIRLFGISVHLEGNVIDLGSYQLQVVEACSGLRYLFPLLALSIIASYFYQAPVWKRLVVIVSSAPITVLMNSIRIGAIGVLVEYGGPGQAEGFLHDFEGWIIFMACVGLLILEIMLLSKVGRDRRPFREVFGLELPAELPREAVIARRTVSYQAIAALVVLAAGVIASYDVGGREEIVPQRHSFATFPMQIGNWSGRADVLEGIVLDVLKLDDYVMADYRDTAGNIVNFYVAYYTSQRSGASAHSPRSCLPGAGWRMESLDEATLPTGSVANRVLIRQGGSRQLVYYWFKQRDRELTNEFVVKWYLLWDALTRNRTDGALVRFTTVLRPGEDVEAADKRLQDFSAAVLPRLKEYVPD
jgi:exosortase D (VPLPA-CTERM-specific)